MTRIWIPKNFHFMRIGQESVEVVLASDYDALARQLAEAVRERGKQKNYHHLYDGAVRRTA